MSRPLEYMKHLEDTYTSAALGSSEVLEEGDDPRLSQLEAEIQQKNEELLRANASLEASQEQLSRAHSEMRDAGGYLGRINEAVERRAGGDWKELALLLASSAVGLGLGYVLQKTMDQRIPWVALAGLGLATVGVVIRTRWSVRGSMVVGGAMLAGGSTLYVFTMPPPAASDGVMML